MPMHGVTTAIVGFLFVCVVFPNLIKNRPQYYVAFGIVCLIIALDAIAMAIHPTEMSGFRVFAYAAVGFLQVAAILILFLAAGGISWRELADDMTDAVEVIRRGESTKEVIIPLSSAMAELKAKRQAQTMRDSQTASVSPIPVDEPGAAGEPKDSSRNS